MQKVKDILAELKKKGYRFTNARVAILTLFASSAKPLTYFDIKKLLLKKKLSTNKATIYRELAFLKKQNFIQELDFGYEAKHYEMMSENHHHHIVCTECETIDHIELEKDLEKEEKKIAKNNNFKIFNHSLEFYGLCQKCQLSAK